MLKNPRIQAYIFLSINVLLWGLSGPISKTALDYVTPFQFLFYRYLIASLAAIPLLYIFLRKNPISTKQFGTIIALELIGITLALSFLYEALSRTSAIEVVLISITYPIFVTLGGVLFLGEKEEAHEWIGFAIALIAVSIITLEPIISGRSSFTSGSYLGNIIAFGYPVFWSIYLLIAKRAYKNTPKLAVGLISPYIGLISFLILTILKQPEFTQPIALLSPLTNQAILLPALYLGIFSSLVALTCYIKGNSLIEASEASLFGYAIPLVTIPVGVIFLSETFTSIMALGLLLLTTGLIIAEKRFNTRKN